MALGAEFCGHWQNSGPDLKCMMGFCRWVLQVVLVILVAFFGYHYFARPELHSCVSIPLATLQGRTKIDLDQEKVDRFMDQVSHQMQGVASNGARLLDTLASGEAQTDMQDLADSDLLDAGQYLYCKAVVRKVENE